jgi:hypothetical protein
MSAININLVIEQGSDFDVDFTIRNDDGTPLNLTDYTAECFLKKHTTSTSSYSFDVTFIDRIAGEIAISMGSTVTSNLKEGRHMYDVLLTSGTGTKTRVIQGNILVNPGVTL